MPSNHEHEHPKPDTSNVFSSVIPPFHTHSHHDHSHHNHPSENGEDDIQELEDEPSQNIANRFLRRINFLRSRSRRIAPITSDSSDPNDDEESFVEKLGALADKIKSVDGIDETAHLLGQILPGIAAPIATASILTFATPFVFLGIIGMKHEYEQAKEELVAILESGDDSTREILQNLTKFSADKIKILNERLNLKLSDSQIELIERQAENTNISDSEFVENIYNHTAILNRKAILKISKKYGWTGILGMSGMSAGMIPASAAAGMEIATESLADNAPIALEISANIAEKVAGSFFLIGQSAMFAYAISRGVQGKKGKETLDLAQEIFQNFISRDIYPKLQPQIYGLSEEESDYKALILEVVDKSTANILEIFDRENFYLNKTSIQYAKHTAIGQVFMGAGTICGLSGAGIIVAAPLLAIGAPLTISPAIQRIIAQEKEQKFSGNSSKSNDYVKDFLLHFDSAKLLSPSSREDKYDLEMLKTIFSEDEQKVKYKKAFIDISKQIPDITLGIAKSKINSVILHLVNDKKYQNCSPERKLEILETKLTPKKQGLRLNSSTLERSVIIQMNNFIYGQHGPYGKNYALQLFKSDKIEANKKLTQDSLLLLHNLESKEELSTCLDEDQEIEIMKKLSVKSAESYHDLSLKNIAKASRQAINEVKNSLKAIRFELASKAVMMSSLHKIHEDVKEAQETTAQIPSTAINSDSLPARLQDRAAVYEVFV